MEPDQILEKCYQEASTRPNQPLIVDSTALRLIEQVCRSSVGAPVRALLACLLAKVHRPELDIRKPYTEIGTEDSYSGRTYDERYISSFIQRHKLPCNSTTAFLTPAFRTNNQPLEANVQLHGKPREPYDAFINLLQLVQNGSLNAQELLTEIIRQLLLLKNERQQQISLLIQRINTQRSELTAESIIQIVSRHLQSRRSSRLPVLLVAAAYDVAQDYLRKRPKPLQPHTAADVQAGTLGDLEIEFSTHQQLAVVYEMKTRRITLNDLDRATQKVAESSNRIDQYVFITTAPVDTSVHERAAQLSKQFGIELMILDCIQFLKHFIHLFYELRMAFLDRYEQLLLQEPESAVSHELKRKFLKLRTAAQHSSEIRND
jgi:DNA adenine methylase